MNRNEMEALISRMEKNGFTVEVAMNPVGHFDGIVAKELPRALKVTLGLDELRPVLNALLPAYKEEQRCKFFKAVQKLEVRKTDGYMFDE